MLHINTRIVSLLHLGILGTKTDRTLDLKKEQQIYKFPQGMDLYYNWWYSNVEWSRFGAKSTKNVPTIIIGDI